MSTHNSKIFSKINFCLGKNKSDWRSHSRRRTDCDYRGLGQSLSKQKPTHSVNAEWMGFAHLYYRCIACSYYAKFGITLASNAYGAPYAKNTHFRPGESACFLLVEAPPQTPVNKNLFQVTLPSGQRLRNWKLLSLIVSGWMTGETICPLVLLHLLK